ncbi:MAG: hypothetical protein HN347_12710, partial [Bacteroidetes bacterium]|nr:hypothetical protein [Bacteroidota bacterium]
MNEKISNWFKKHYKDRKLIENQEYKISFIQFVGFALIFIGILYLLFKLVFSTNGNALLNGENVSITFFIIMLGVSLAFPSLLKDQNKEVSTMRIVVFMMTNVICLLLLKVGWDANDFYDIGIDQYWVGIIAFVFGAKATQAFFESKMAVPRKEPERSGTAALIYSHAELAKLAGQTHEKESQYFRQPELS